jgi:hypothetical protein
VHPNQFHVNEAWIAFKLNDAPIPTEADGGFNIVALMDAASCFILSTAPVSASAVEPSKVLISKMIQPSEEVAHPMSQRPESMDARSQEVRHGNE